MMDKNAVNADKQEYRTPILFEYGDIASITQAGEGPVNDNFGGVLSGG